MDKNNIKQAGLSIVSERERHSWDGKKVDFHERK